MLMQCNGKRGSILVMVLWVLALLTMITAYYATQTRITRNAAQYAYSSIVGKEAALSVLRLVAKYLRPEGGEDAETEGDTDQGPLIHPSTTYETRVGQLDVEFRVENEAGKVDLNRVDEAFLRGFLRFVIGGENPKEADTICDSILDWIDTDKLTRINGAEDAFYQDKVPPYHAANGPFKSVHELLLVNGVTPRLFWGPLQGENIPEGWSGGLKDLFTVFGGQKIPNPDYAPLPIKAYMEDAQVTGASTASNTWLLRLKAASRGYEIYWESSGKEGFKVVFWHEGALR